MVLHISFWTEEEGAPIFLCQFPRDDTSIPLAVLSATHGVFSFVKHKGSEIKKIGNEDLEVHWEEVSEGLRLILIRSGSSVVDDNSCQCLLELSFLALQMSCSEEDLRPSNPELRWYIKPAVSRIQNILESIAAPDCLVGELTVLPDVVIVDNYSLMQSYLDAFCKGIGVQYASVNVFGRRAACTPQWHLMTPAEQVSLSLLGRKMGQNCSRADVPLYIPSLSRKIPFRFIFLTLIHGINLILICGSHPPLSEITTEVHRFWAPGAMTLRTAFHSIPRGLPPAVTLPPEVTAFALLNRDPKMPFCLASAVAASTSVGGQQGAAGGGDSNLDLAQRRQLLRELLHETEDLKDADVPLPQEGYYATSEYRAHFLRRDALLLLVILHRNVPLLATGSIAESTLAALQKALPS